MQLNNFSPAQPRPMPVFLLVDTSGSMRGEKIQSVNMALRDMVASFRAVNDIRGEIQLAIITFGEEVTIAQELAPLDQLALTELEAAGKTPMGSALEFLLLMLEDKDIVLSRAYTPTVVLISDGIPTDVTRELWDKAVAGETTVADFLDWPPLNALHVSERGSKCIRLAMGIGDDANNEMLTAFVNRPGVPVIKARDARGIEEFFQWVTLSVTSRSVSKNPDMLAIPDFDDFADAEIVI